MTNTETDIETPRMSTQIPANMMGVDVTIKRPSGRIQMKNAEVTATDDQGHAEQVEVGKGKVTKPCFIIDTPRDHQFWADVDETSREVDRVLRRFSANDVRRGFHLVPMFKTGQMLSAMRIVRQKRLDIVTDFTTNHWDEWISNLKSKFNGHFYLVEPKIPARESMRLRFDLSWTFNPLTPISAETLTFEELNDTDRRAIIDESNRMAQELVSQRANSIYEQVFGEVLAACHSVSAGAFESGKRRFGAITELIDMLDRLRNFKDICSNPEILKHASNASQLLATINDISMINAHEGQNRVTEAIKVAFAPLGESIKKMLDEVIPGGGRAVRRVGV